MPSVTVQSDKILFEKDLRGGWTSTPNALLNDHRISAEARWLWTWINSHSATFIVRMDVVMKIGNFGRDKARRVMRELEEYGYLLREQQHDPETQRYGIPRYELKNPWSEPVTEKPSPVPTRQKAAYPQVKPGTENPSTADPAPENQASALTSENTEDPQVGAGDWFPGAGKPDPLKNNNSSKKKNNPPSGGARARAHEACRIPEDFAPTREMKLWFNKRCPNIKGRGTSETEKFCNHWIAESGPRASKKDWEAAWRVWMLKANDWSPRPRSGTTVYSNSNGEVER